MNDQTKVKIKILKEDQWGKFKVGKEYLMVEEGAKRYVNAGFAEYVEDLAEETIRRGLGKPNKGDSKPLKEKKVSEVGANKKDAYEEAMQNIKAMKKKRANKIDAWDEAMQNIKAMEKKRANKKDEGSYLNKQLDKFENEFKRVKGEVIDLLLQKNKEEATESIVDYIKEKNPLKTTRNDERSEIWLYKEGIYLPEGESYIQEITREFLGKGYTTQLVNIIINKIRADTFVDQETFFNEQNKHPHLITVNNGILDVKKKILKPFSPKIPFFNKLKMDYDPKQQCNKFESFLSQILISEADIKCIQEMFGYSLYKKYKYKKAFMFEGGGDNGKTQLLKILTEHFIGIENSKELSLSQIEKDNYLMAELQNKLVNVSADITDTVMDNTGRFKNLCGGDPIGCSRKFKTSVTLINYAKLIFATNELPIPKDNSSGFWGRWVLIEFPYKFLKKEEIDELPELERLNCKVAIPDIIETIIDDNQLSGILNWALEGFQRLEKQKGFTYNESRKVTEKKWMSKANSFIDFAENKIECSEKYIVKGDLKKAYLEYCKKNRVPVKDDKIIKEYLEKEFGVVEGRPTITDDEGNKKSLRVWNYISFKNCQPCHSIHSVEFPKRDDQKSLEAGDHGLHGKGGNKIIKNKVKNSEGSSFNTDYNKTPNRLNKTGLINYIEAKKITKFEYATFQYELINDNFVFEPKELKKYLNKMLEDGDLMEPTTECYQVL